MSNVKGKAILFVRVSTQRQNMDEQEQQTYDLAIREGYAPENIVPICEKESGINLTEEERVGINRMKEEIEKGGVTAVYMWEISRLARNPKVRYSIYDYLQNHKVQMVIKEPYIRYFNEDFSVNETSAMMVAMLGVGADMEKAKLKAREKRTKTANALKGKWNGGKNIKYGYTLDDKKYYIVNEEEAKGIRLAYELYTTTPMGQTLLRKELQSRGYDYSLDRLQKILSDIGYTGEPYITDVYVNGKLKKGYTIKYPAIITKEIFEKAEAKRNESNVNCYRGQSFYFAKGLFRCPQCGYAYQGYKKNKIYCCLAYKHDNKDIPKCHNNVTININLLDSLLYYVGVTEHTEFITKNYDDEREKFLNNISILHNKIAFCEKEIEESDLIIERYDDIYARDGKKDKWMSNIKKVNDKVNEFKQQISVYVTEIEQIQRLLDAPRNVVAPVAELLTYYKRINETDILKKMSDLVHNYVSSVAVEDVEKFTDGLNGKSKQKKITIQTVSGKTKIFYAYNFSNIYKYWNEDKKPLPIKLVLREIGR